MSGGHFDYKQYNIDIIVDEIEQIITKNDDPDHYYGYSQNTIRQFKLALFKLKEAAIYAQRIDWLVSGDDGEESFHSRLREELDSLYLG
jgi:hypothetical protein